MKRDFNFTISDDKLIGIARIAIADEKTAERLAEYMPQIGRDMLHFLARGEVNKKEYCTASLPATDTLTDVKIRHIKMIATIDRVNDKGFRVIDLSMRQLQSLGSGCPVCDSCSTPLIEGGTYIGVLGNRTYCKVCYDEWDKRANFHKEDVAYEDRVTNRMLGVLNK